MHIFFLLTLFCVSVFALNLTEALEDLRKHNTQLKISKQEIVKSEQNQKRKKASQYGSIDVQSSISKYNQKRPLAPLAPPIAPNTPTDDTLSSVGISYRVTLFNGFRDTSQVELSNIATSMQETKHRLTLAQLEFNVQSLFCDIASLKKRLSSTKEHQKALTRIYEFSQKEYALGKKSQLELLKIKSDRIKTETTAIELQTKIAILKQSLSLLIYSDVKDFELHSSSLDVKVGNFTIDNIAQIKFAVLSTKAKEKSLQSSKSLYYPKLDLATSYSDVYGDSTKENISSATLNLNWKIYDFGAREAQVQESNIEQIQANLELKQTKEIMARSIFEAQHNINKTEQLLKSAKIDLQLAKKTAEIEELMYKEGQKDISDYLLSLALYAQSKANLVNTKYALIKSKYYLNTLIKE